MVFARIFVLAANESRSDKGRKCEQKYVLFHGACQFLGEGFIIEMASRMFLYTNEMLK